MALTPGFKKFIGLIIVVGAVGGGLYYYKTMPKTQHVDTVQIEPQQAEVPQPVSSPIFQTRQVEKIVEQVAPQAPAPQVQVQQADPSANRGMSALMNAGKR